MSRSDFGRIVASLRKELRNEFDEVMTQSDLADLAGLPLITLQKIEQGKQANLKPEVVLRLADALSLSYFSRRSFYQASLGLEAFEQDKPRVGASIIMDEMKTLLNNLQTPAFITNGFSDLCLVNPSFLHILNISKVDLDRGHLLCRYNLNRIYSAPEFEAVHQMFGDAYPAFARRRAFIFKALTLKYRNHWYFQKILPELNRYPKFRQYWQSSSFQNEEIYILSNKLTLHHPRYGTLNFVSFPIQTNSDEIDLYLTCYQPFDSHAADVCCQVIKDAGTEPVEFPNWLIPSKPDFFLGR